MKSCFSNSHFFPLQESVIEVYAELPDLESVRKAIEEAGIEYVIDKNGPIYTYDAVYYTHLTLTPSDLV